MLKLWIYDKTVYSDTIIKYNELKKKFTRKTHLTRLLDLPITVLQK